MHHYLSTVRALRAAQTASAFAAWLRGDGGDRLSAAAELLGGEKWRGRADAALTAVAEGVEIADLVDELSDLHSLLTLELTDDLDSEETALFVAIHPDDPRADDVRRCAEALERGLAALAIVTAAGAPDNREAA